MKRVPTYSNKISSRPDNFFKDLPKENCRRPSDTACNQVLFKTAVTNRGVIETQSTIENGNSYKNS